MKHLEVMSWCLRLTSFFIIYFYLFLATLGLVAACRLSLVVSGAYCIGVVCRLLIAHISVVSTCGL